MMKRLKVMGIAFVAALAIGGTAVASAQARMMRSGTAAGPSFGEKHKHGKTFEYCGSVEGCGAEFVVYPRTKTWESPQLEEHGVIEERREYNGKYGVRGKKFLIFWDPEDKCYYVGVKTKTGYNSEAEQLEWDCGASFEEHTAKFEESWYALK